MHTARRCVRRLGVRVLHTARPCARCLSAGLLLAAALLPAGCGSDDGAGSAREPATLAPPQHVSGSYSLDGRQQRVRATIAPVRMAAGQPNSAAVIPEGRKAMQVDLRIRDSGRDPLDVSILRFSARDSAGRPVAEAYRLPARKLEPENPKSPRSLQVAFLIPRNERLVDLSARSILSALPLRLRWRLRG